VNEARVAYAKEFLGGRRGPFRFDICRIPFNEGKGGEARPVPRLRERDEQFFPRVSPDGRWLVFTMAKSYMLLQPDSQLYIVPVEGGSPGGWRATPTG